MTNITSTQILESDPALFRETKTHAPGPEGALPITPEMLLTQPSGNLFGLSQNAGMGWNPAELLNPEYLILSTHGGLRAADGTPIALGFHTGHWEVGLLVAEAARTLRDHHATPFAGACTDPCDGRTQGTEGMLDSLPYRNDAAIVLRRLMRSLPTRSGVLGIATCDKGLPAMMMALASSGPYPSVLIPGGVTLLPEDGEDAGKVQTIGARYSQQQITLEYAAEIGCRACASPGGGCQFLGTAATSQVVGEALGLSLPHSALAPSGQPIWLDAAARSALAILRLTQNKIATNQILTDAAIRNAMVLHAAFGGSTNLLLHIPAIAHAAGLRRPNVNDWTAINREVPRLVDALPNGPRNFATVQVFLAGAVPEVMLHLRRAGLLDTSVLTASGETLDQNLNWWEQSERRRALHQRLRDLNNIDPHDVIMSPDQARSRGLTATVCFPSGNLAPQGSVIKSTSIDPTLIDETNTYRHTGPARVFTTEASAIDAIKHHQVGHGDVIVLICGGPMGSGMQEIYQITSALKNLPFCKHVAVLTDARFSGVSTGACIGHISPEALANGPIGRIHEGDIIEIIVDRNNLHGTVNLIADPMVDLIANPLEHIINDPTEQTSISQSLPQKLSSFREAGGSAVPPPTPQNPPSSLKELSSFAVGGGPASLPQISTPTPPFGLSFRSAAEESASLPTPSPNLYAHFTPEAGTQILAARPPRPDLAPHPALPDDTRLWAALTQASGGVWGGCVYDTDSILAKLQQDSPGEAVLLKGTASAVP